MSEDDKNDSENNDKNVVSLSEVRKEKSKPSVFKSGVDGQWEQYPNKLEALNSHFRHIITMMRTTADHMEALISVRRDIRETEYDLAEYDMATENEDKDYREALVHFEAELRDHEDGLGQVVKEECLKPLIMDLHEYEMIDLEDIIDAINEMAEDE